MFINKRVFFLIISFLFIFNYTFVFANPIELEEEKLDKQNEVLYEGIMNKEDKDYINELHSYMNRESSSEISLSKLSKNVEIFFIKLSLFARKYALHITVLVLIYNVFMIAFVGAKSLKNRKYYIVSSVVFYLLFLIIINLPVYLLWRNSSGANEIQFLGRLPELTKGIVNFFRDNSFEISVILFAYGVVSYIPSEYDIPKRLSSVYMMKMSFVMFGLFRILPFVLKLAI